MSVFAPFLYAARFTKAFISQFEQSSYQALVMPDLSTSSTCLLCETTATQVCARCKSTHYCSRECQRDDWPAHKLLCASFSVFDMSARPSATHFRGIVFPENHSKPQVTWLDCRWPYESGGDGYQHPDLDTFFGPGAPITCTLLRTDALLQKRLPDPIDIVYRDTFLVDGSRPNNSVAAILETLPGSSIDWRGPIVAVGKKGEGLDPPHCRDLDMNDFRYIADHLISHERWPMEIEACGMASDQKVVKGIRINCLGDCQVFKRPHYEPVDVLSIDPIFNVSWCDTSDIAERIGLPILTRHCPVSLRWGGKKEWHDFCGQSPYSNQDATSLHLCCDPTADSSSPGPVWSWVAREWHKSVGSIIVVRRDRKPLAAAHIEALCKYCRDEVQTLMERSRGGCAPDETLTRDYVLKTISRPMFSIYWYKFREQKQKEGNAVPELSPYEV